MALFCARCGAAVVDEARFCIRCGSAVAAAPTPSVPSSSLAPAAAGIARGETSAGGRRPRVLGGVLAVAVLAALAAGVAAWRVHGSADPAKEAATAYGATNGAWLRGRTEGFEDFCKGSFAFGAGMVFEKVDDCVASSKEQAAAQSEEEFRHNGAVLLRPQNVTVLDAKTVYFWSGVVEFTDGRTSEVPADAAAEMATVMRDVPGVGWRIVGLRIPRADPADQGTVPARVPADRTSDVTAGRPSQPAP